MGSLVTIAAATTIAALTILACELTVPTDSLQNGVCGAGLKACSDRCVRVTDPSYHCASRSCAPCSFPNATAKCSLAGECVISICQTEANRGQIWADCNHDAADGCEVDINHDALNCGKCGAQCVLPNVVETGCSGQTCTIIRCADGFVDCNQNARNGCEAPNDGGCDGSEGGR